jgi:cytochrome P450
VAVVAAMTLSLMLQSKADAAAEYGNQTPAENSIMHLLGRASDKSSGKALSETQIVAQTYTFMLAGTQLTFAGCPEPWHRPSVCSW